MTDSNESRRLGLLRLRHLLEVAEATGEEMAAERPRFQALANPSAAPTVVSSFNLFQTPADLAARLVALIPTLGRTLEPSAGLGRLYRAIRNASADCHVTLVDVSPDCCRELYKATEGDSNARLVTGDFLEMDAGRLGTFDAIVMNPPFKNGADVKHIRHARELLNPGGRLVAICANGPRQREKLMPEADQWIDLPEGSFKEAGTNVSTAIVVFDN